MSQSSIEYREWRHQVHSGLKQLQDSRVQLYEDTELFRWYSSTLVPGLLQTEDYAAAVLRTVRRFHDLSTDDSVEAARARVGRSQVIREPGHQFELIVEEWVLRSRIANTSALSGQLQHLLTASELPTVSLGIIPQARDERILWPRETFHVFDDSLVTVELVSAEVNVTQPSEIAQYVKAFEQLRSMAVYGAEARALILRAIEALH
ncbi:DUF5753 domain-containing protein [Streptomyces violaceusniger]|uniref:DUF5753 domain-containing protein n=1 Tax=Streptomyces violaceusniger TaxID=68280 RepID=UPI00382222AA